jgi:hypothetical protein
MHADPNALARSRTDRFDTWRGARSGRRHTLLWRHHALNA